MKVSVIGVLLLGAVTMAPAQAAFTINCKTMVDESGMAAPLPAKWVWDGAELRVTLTTPARELQTSDIKPALFQKFDVPLQVPVTSYAFVMSVRPDNIRISQTFLVSKGKEPLSMSVVTAMVLPQGHVMHAIEHVYRDCSLKEA